MVRLLLRANAEQRFRRAHIVPAVVRVLRQRAREQLLAFLALSDADVPGADFRLAGVVIRVAGEHLLIALLWPVILARGRIHGAEGLPVAPLRFGTSDPVEER